MHEIDVFNNAGTRTCNWAKVRYGPRCGEVVVVVGWADKDVRL